MSKATRKLKNIKFLDRIKKHTTRKSWKDYLWGLTAIPVYLLPASLLGINGYAGWGVATVGAFLYGALMDKDVICDVAIGVSATHLLYARLQPGLNKAGLNLFRFEGTSGVADNLSAYNQQELQPNTYRMNLPGVNNPVVYRKMDGTNQLNDYVAAGTQRQEAKDSIRASKKLKV